MPHRINCWEFFNCGREPGGLMAEQLGVCPAAQAMAYDGVNDGIAGGRCCWEVSAAMTECRRALGQTPRCSGCAFRRRVLFEEQHPSGTPLPSTTA